MQPEVANTPVALNRLAMASILQFQVIRRFMVSLHLHEETIPVYLHRCTSISEVTRLRLVRGRHGRIAADKGRVVTSGSVGASMPVCAACQRRRRYRLPFRGCLRMWLKIGVISIGSVVVAGAVLAHVLGKVPPPDEPWAHVPRPAPHIDHSQLIAGHLRGRPGRDPGLPEVPPQRGRRGDAHEPLDLGRAEGETSRPRGG